MLQPLTRTLETANLHSTDKASSLIIGQPGTGCLLETYSRTSIVHAYVRFVSSIRKLMVFSATVLACEPLALPRSHV